METFTTAMYTPPDSPSPEQKTRQVWTPEEDRLLSEAVAKEMPKQSQISWNKVASHLPGRNNKDCRKRWHYSVANTIRKGTWLREEDERLRDAVERYGARWSKIAEAVGTRNGDQCWKRWYDCLDPRIDKSPWTAEEDAKLLHLVSQHGRNWSDIVHTHFPNRTSLAAKNRFSILQRKHEGAASLSRSGSTRSTRSVRHPKPRAGASPSPSSCSSATTSTVSTPSLYLSVPATPSAASPRSPSPYCLAGAPATPLTTAYATPEPEAFELDEAPGWLSFTTLTDAEMDDLLSQSAQEVVGPEWWCGSGASMLGTQAPEVDYDELGPYGQGQWMSGASTDTWATTTPDGQGYGNNTLGIYQNDGYMGTRGSSQRMYDTSSGLLPQGDMGNWPGPFDRGVW